MDKYNTIQIVPRAQTAVPGSAVPSLSLALRPGMGFLPHFLKYLLVIPPVILLPSIPFSLTGDVLGAFLSNQYKSGAI